MNHDVHLYRSNMRGLRKCTGCGKYNGNRAKGCANDKCSLHYLKKGPTDRRKPQIDAVQLVTYNDTKIFSVRVKDRDPAQRNFVQIIDITLTADQDGSIVSRNAICFVDTCKYDSTDLNISCKHVKSASECTKKATELKVTKDVLYALNIVGELKEYLWSVYCEHEQTIPAVQRVNKSTFVVKCKVSATQAAGRLHASVSTDDDSEFHYSCGCKKLRIVLSPNDSVVMENATCDHLILILAGILSCGTLRREYQKFVDALSSLCTTKNTKADCTLPYFVDFNQFSENILNSSAKLSSVDNSSETEKLFDFDPTMQMTVENVLDDEQIQFINVPITTDEVQTEFETANLELAECQIELMDEFKLTNQIDLCHEDLQLCEADLFAENQVICNMNGNESVDGSAQFIHSETYDAVARMSPTIQPEEVAIKPNLSGKHIKPPNERIVDFSLATIAKPSLGFDEWLGFIIERINHAIDFNCETPAVVQSFDVKNDFFTYLSYKFSVGDKRRIPNSTTIIKKGKHKDLVKSKWIFTNSSTVLRIFTTKQTSIDLERIYMEKSPGYFVPYDTSEDTLQNAGNQNKKLKRILPSMFKVFIQFGAKNKESLNGFAIEWIPDVFSISQFGVMRIQFTLGFKKNNKIINRFTELS